MLRETFRGIESENILFEATPIESTWAAPIESRWPEGAKPGGNEAAPGTDESSQRAVPLSDIGLGKPLSLRITSMYPGNREYHSRDNVGSVLITSAAQFTETGDPAPLALQHVFHHAPAGKDLDPVASKGGSDVIYYSPAMIHNELNLEVRMSFDKTDELSVTTLTDAVGKIAGLPVFAVIPGAKQAGAIIYATATAIKFAANLYDRFFDSEPDWVSTWKLNVHRGGFIPAEASFILFFGDNAPAEVEGPNDGNIGRAFRYRDEQYIVDLHDGTLRYRDRPEMQVLGEEPYVLALLNGADEPDLTKWTASAVTASLYQRFFGAQNNDGSQDVVGILEAYNDVVMTRKIAEYDKALAKLPEDQRQGSDFQLKRDGALKNIQDSDLADMLRD